LIKLTGHTSTVLNIKKLSNDRLLSNDLSSIKLWNINSGECLKTFMYNAVTCLEILNEDKIVFGSNRTINVLDLNSGKLLQSFLAHTHGVECIDTITDDKLISASPDGEIKVWCLTKKDCIKSIKTNAVNQRFVSLFRVYVLGYLECSVTIIL